MRRREELIDEWLGEPDVSLTRPVVDRSSRGLSWPGGGLAAIFLMLGILIWFAQVSPDHSTAKSLRGKIQPQDQPPRVLAFAAEGRLLATGHVFGCVKILDLSQYGDDHQEIGNHPGATVRAVALSPDGHWVVSSGDDPALKWWEAGSGKLKSSHVPGAAINRLAFSPDGKTLATGSMNGTVTLRDVETDREAAHLAGRAGAIRGLAFSADGATLAIAADRGELTIWDVATGRVRDALQYRDSMISSLSLTADGKKLAFVWMGQGKPEVRIWTLAGGHEAIRVLDQQTGYHLVAFSPDGKHLAATLGGQGVQFWEVETGQRCTRYIDYEDIINAMSYSPDGRSLALAVNQGVGLFSVDLDRPEPGRP